MRDFGPERARADCGNGRFEPWHWLILRTSKAATFPRKGFCCLPSESRTEGGRRQGRDGQQSVVGAKVNTGVAVVRGSCRLPRFVVAPGPVKSVARTARGASIANTGWIANRNDRL